MSGKSAPAWSSHPRNLDGEGVYARQLLREKIKDTPPDQWRFDSLYEEMLCLVLGDLSFIWDMDARELRDEITQLEKEPENGLIRCAGFTTRGTRCKTIVRKPTKTHLSEVPVYCDRHDWSQESVAIWLSRHPQSLREVIRQALDEGKDKGAIRALLNELFDELVRRPDVDAVATALKELWSSDTTEGKRS